mmetsp:Transcript_20477/g.57606  ORF Transcript_20477/g.57606 Transcript_20477/m.57606 type:complete len:329 (-) Transcript_20477:357-1343(-)
MGVKYSLEANQDSQVEPGKKVVQTSELPEVTSEGLAEGIMDMLRRPVPPHVEPAVKDVEVEETSENSFSAKVILDGVKLDQAGYGKDGKDKVFQWLKVTYNPAEMLASTESFVPEGGAWADEASGGKVFLATYSRFLKDPTRIEYWWVKDGERMAGESQAQHFKFYIDALMEIAKPRKVSFSPDCDSIAEPGQKSILSAPMDDHIAFDTLWQELLNHKAFYGLIIQGAEVQEVSDNEVLVTGENGVEPAGGAFAVEWNKDEGKIVRTHKVAGKAVEVNHTVVHQSPLRIEAWRLDAQGPRVSNKNMAKRYSIIIDMLLEKVAKDSSWF